MRGSVILSVTLVILVVIAVPYEVHAQRSLRLGAGVHLDENSPGVTAALDVPIGGSVFGVSPFFDFHSKSGSQVLGVGINVLIKKAEGKAWVYLGGGGGYGSVRSERDFLSAAGTATQKVSSSKGQAMADAVFGVEYNATEKAAIFIQAKWLGFFGGNDQTVALPDGTSSTVDLGIRNFAFHVGLSFRMGGGSDDY
jgi:hypothetical protein